MKKIEIIEIFIAQGGNCFYCHRPMSWTPGSYATSYTKDHFYAKSKGNGLNGNTVLAHEKCNHDKESRDPNKYEKLQFKKLYKKIEDRAEKLEKMKDEKRKMTPKCKDFGKW